MVKKSIKSEKKEEMILVTTSRRDGYKMTLNNKTLIIEQGEIKEVTPQQYSIIKDNTHITKLHYGSKRN